MKKLKFILLSMALFSFVSCEEVKDLIDIDIDKEITIDLPITLDNADSDSVDVEFSLTSDDEVNEYIRFLENITIHSFKASVTSYTGDEAIYNLQLAVDDDLIFTLNSANIKEIYTHNQEITIKDKTTLTKIANRLLQNKKITISGDAENVSGSQVTTNFNVRCVIQMTITANPL